MVNVGLLQQSHYERILPELEIRMEGRFIRTEFQKLIDEKLRIKGT